ncbi:hypothetical protein PVK06_030688 [Gossypium arboreum]|uniref:Uncharacterized protein n=1 Tax=Gossypium arboreum TaxID=29729 RepID=A0ABR0NS61_GOSAR|nr:hypothetical protein PVK06_030688 [Gossypium arboreum]
MLSSSSIDIANRNEDDASILDDSSTKKFRFKDLNVSSDDVMVVDVKKYFIDGVPSIDFSERVYQLLEKEMSTSVILKMLGKNLGISTLQNRLCRIWRSSSLFN